MADLCAIPQISKHNDTKSVQRNFSLSSALMEDILRDKHHAAIIVMATLGEEIDQGAWTRDLEHQVHDDQFGPRSTCVIRILE